MYVCMCIYNCKQIHIQIPNRKTKTLKEKRVRVEVKYTIKRQQQFFGELKTFMHINRY